MACGACNHKDPVSVFFRRVPMRLATQNASTSPTQTAIEGRCFPCVPVRSAYPSGDHVQHAFLYKKDLNITQQLSLENMLNQTPLAHGVATTLPDAFRVRITRKTCCQNQTQRLSQVRVATSPTDLSSNHIRGPSALSQQALCLKEEQVTGSTRSIK